MGLGPVFGDQTFHDYYYRVDQAYTHSNRPAYSASGGYGGMQFGASFGKYFDKLWVGLFGRADFLNGATFADSPLVKTNTNFLVGLAVSYIFWESKTLVEADK
jgi:outer membrane scaffolding protein for murein synthesis (MipA/OmpV family)